MKSLLKYSSTVFILTSLLSGCDLFSSSDSSKLTLNHSKIIVDAGSSKSKLYLYEYTEKDGKMPISIKNDPDNEAKVNGGVAKLDYNDNQAINKYLSTLFTPVLADKIKQINTSAAHDNKILPVESLQFYSTAGMREINENDQHQLNSVVRVWIEGWLNKHDIKLVLDVKTITGAAEGAYGWSSLYYLNNNQKEIGFSELGGASTQVTYHLANDANVSVTLGGKVINLRSESYPLGQDTVEAILSEHSACLLSGYSYSNGIEGNGDFDTCRSIASNLIDEKTVNAPGADMVENYSLFAGFINTANDFNIADNYTLGKVATKGTAFCQQTWDEVLENNPDLKPNDKFAPYNCLALAYQDALLTHGYGLSDQKQKFKVTNQYSGKGVAWTMGVALVNNLQE